MKMENLKRKKVKSSYGGIDVYNPSPKQRKEMTRDVSELNTDMVKTFTKELKEKGFEEGQKADTELINEVMEIVMKKESSKSDYMLKKYIRELTNIPKEILDDEDLLNEIIEDPSDELRYAIKDINEILSEFVDDYQSLFEKNLKKLVK